MIKKLKRKSDLTYNKKRYIAWETLLQGKEAFRLRQWGRKGLCGVFVDGVRYIREADYGRFQNKELPKNNYGKNT